MLQVRQTALFRYLRLFTPTDPHPAEASGVMSLKALSLPRQLRPGFETIKSSTEVSVGLFLFMVTWGLRASDSLATFCS